MAIPPDQLFIQELYNIYHAYAACCFRTALWFSGLDRRSKRFFAACFIVLLLCSIAGPGDTVLCRFHGLETLKQIFLFLEVTAFTLSLPMLTASLP